MRGVFSVGRRMIGKMFLASFLVLMFSSPAWAQSAAMQNGLGWLAGNQGTDGYWPSAEVTDYHATAEALKTLTLLSPASSALITGRSWLETQDASSTDFLARRIMADISAGVDVSAKVDALLALRVPSSGWGGYPDFSENLLDTALALQALKAANHADSTILNPALAYLTTSQNADGGWGFIKGDDSSIYLTAVVSAILQQFPQMTTIATAVSKATANLLAHQNPDGGFGNAASTAYETALAYAALVSVTANEASLGNAVGYLTATQTANGSWGDDPYSTALALTALYLAENRPSPPPPPPAGGAITGTVMDASTNQRLSGVVIVLGSDSLINTTTDNSGNFTLNDVPPGSQQIYVSLAGYQSATVPASVTVDATVSLGSIGLVSSYATGTIAGTITDPAGKPLSGVSVTVAGAWSGTATTGIDGRYLFTFVTPGEMTITAAKEGYQSVTAPGTVYARMTLSFSPQLSTAPSQATTSTLVGRVVDSHWGLPIDHLPGEKGVTVTLSGGITAAPDPNNRGLFSIQDLAPGTYQVTVGMNGYASQTFRVAIAPGVTTDLGTIRLAMTISKMLLTGQVTDAVSGAPIRGAEISVGGTSLTGRTDTFGIYAIADISHPSTITVRASVSGYTGKSFLVRTQPFAQTMNITLVPRETIGQMIGSVVDASSSQPLAGVALTLVADPSVSVTTDSAGAFTFARVPKGLQQITLALAGYAQRTLTTTIAAGAANNVGVIPLAVEPQTAAIKGTVWDVVANQPFAGVDIRVSGTGAWQTVTAMDGSYRLDDVIPGTVTVTATATARPAYYGAVVAGALKPGGLLVFSPRLTTLPPTTVQVTVQTDKVIYAKNDTISMTVNLRNNGGEDYATALRVMVTNPVGATVYDTTQQLNLAADATLVQYLNLVLPLSTPGGTYKIGAEAFDASGMLLGVGTKMINVETSRISVTPMLPAVLTTGVNTVSFNLANTGTLTVSAGVFNVMLKDPDGEVISTATQAFALGLGEDKTLACTVSIPSLKFGTYTLTYAQSDETIAGAATELALPNTLAITALFDNNSHRIRTTAGLTVSLTNAGRFDLDPTGEGLPVTVSVPDADLEMIKTLVPAPAAGNAAGSALLYQFAIPETVTAGLHQTTVMVTLPSGSTLVQTTQLAILESSLALSSIQDAFVAGTTISPVITNNGGVDTPVQYTLSLYDAKAALIAEIAGTETVLAGASLALVLPIPAGAVDGSYQLVVSLKDLKTGKELITPNPVTITGVKGSLQVQTDKEEYLATEDITALSSMANSGPVLQDGNLQLQVTTTTGTQIQKTWTNQVDFQQGVRSWVDTYGVNDWIVPDDEFEGTAIDANKWDVTGNMTIRSGKAFADSTVNLASLTSKWQLEGDFDIQVDYSASNSVGNQGPQLLVTGNDFYATVHNNIISGNAGDIVVNGVQYYNSTGSYKTSGKLRLTRVADKITVYYWNTSTWTEVIHASSPLLAAPCRIVMKVWRNLGYPTGASAEYDNFRANSCRVRTENQTVGSVRLLPLSDNFDDGVLNEERWQVTAGSVPSENSGALRLTSTAANPSNLIIHRSWLANDFSAVSVFNNFSVTPALTPQGRYIMQANAGGASFYLNRMSNNLQDGVGAETLVSMSQLNNVYQTSSHLPYASNSGRLRLRRAGTTGYTDYWNGTSWVNQHLRTGIPSAAANIQLYTNSQINLPTAQVDLDSLSINKGSYTDNGTITLRHDSGSNGTRWGKILYTSSQPVGTSLKFRSRTAATESTLANALWSDYVTTNDTDVTNPAARWIEIEATLATSNPNATPLIHDLTVIYESVPGQVLWQTDVPANLATSAVSELSSTVGTLGVTGKLLLQGTLTSSTGQTVADAEYPFYVEQGNLVVLLATDKKIYRPGETVTVSGEVRNRSTVTAASLALRVEDPGAGGEALYTESFDLPAQSNRPFTFTTTAGSDGIHALSGTVMQNGTVLSEVSEQFEVASPAVIATLAAPDTVGNAPFVITLTLSNAGKVDAVTSIQTTEGNGSVVGVENVAIPAGETRLVQYSRQISSDTLFTAVVSGDLSQTLTHEVAYVAPAVDNTVTAKIVTDKIAYSPNNAVTLTGTVTASAARENLSALVTVTNSQGQVLYSATTVIPTLTQGQSLTINNTWNVGTNPAGNCLVTMQLLDSTGTVVASATCNLTINSITRPAALLKGKILLDNQSILTGDPVTISYSVTNTGNVDLSGIALSVRTVDLTEEAEYNTITDQATLAMGATYTNSGQVDTQGYSARDYLVVLQATIAEVEETLAGTYFRVEGAPSAPALIGPGNGVDVETFTPALVVSNAADPNDDNLTYEFEIYGDSGLTNLLVSGTVSETTGSTTWTASVPLLENQVYFWRARAYDGRLYGFWMTPASFRVNTTNDSPSAPTISSPTDWTAVAVLNPILTINNSTDPDSIDLTYNFTLALDPDFTQVESSVVGVASGEGISSWMVPVNLQENGLYYWRAQADDWLIEGPWSTTTRFFVNTMNDNPLAPIVAAPANGSMVTALETDIVVINSKDPDSPSLVYYFEVDTVATFDSANIMRSGSVAEGVDTTYWYASGLQDNTQYHARVKASDGMAESPWSPAIGFFVNTVNDAPTTPVLDNPSDGTGVNLFTPTLSVHNSMDLDGDTLTYEFEVYSDAAMTNLVAHSGSIVESSKVTAWGIPLSLTENQTYYWRVRSFDGSFTSDWMPTASFMVNTANDAPGAPLLSAPADGRSLEILNPTLTVVNAVDPDSDQLIYDFEIYSNNVLVDAISGVSEGTDGITSVTLDKALSDNTAYSWRVRAFDGDRYGQWMSLATFTTHIPKAAVKAEIKFEPETLNKQSKGTWVKVDIILPAGYMASEIDISSIRLEGLVPAELWPFSIYHGEHEDKLSVKFRREGVISLLPVGPSVLVHVTGALGSMQFEGIDIIRVID